MNEQWILRGCFKELINKLKLNLYQKSTYYKPDVSSALTSHVIRRPDLVTPIFCVRPRDTCSTSVLSMGRRSGAVIPLPHV